jgi:predicted transcriptional regulator with HTH domain
VFIPLPAIPFTQQPMTLAEADYQDKLLYKGNILQYKGNSSRLTKKQQYTQLAKGFGPNRTKVFATQTQTYTNPNTTGLQRVNFTTYPFPNDLVGKPNNISGPFQYDVPNPNGCLNLDGTPSTAVRDGGSLVCGTLANPCSNELIKANNGSAAICNPASASDVPGTSFLCWNKQLQTWFPRQRYVMNNSGTKWPEGYKGFVSAVVPDAPILTLDSYTNTTASISWVDASGVCLDISSYRIYLNDQLYTTLPYPIRSYTLYNLLGCANNIYVTSVLSGTESVGSNVVTAVVVVAPEAPILTFGISSCDVVLNWTTVSTPCATISSYNIYQDSTFIKSVSYPLTSTTINNLNFAYSYSFYVTSLSNNIQSVPSNVVTTIAVVVNAPILTVAAGCCDVVLNWTIVSSPCIPISSYNIYQDSTFIKSVSYPLTSTTINNLNSNSSYSFYVTSLSNSIQSVPSNVVTAFIGISQITLSASAVPTDNTKVVLSWTSSRNECASSWQLYQNGVLLNSYPAGTTNDTITGLVPGTTHTYYVTSSSPCGSGPQSNVVTVSPINDIVQQTVANSYTYTVPSGALYYNNVTVIGGGGGGGGGSVMGTEDASGKIGGSGGGGGGMATINGSVSITTQTTLTYIVGSNGWGGSTLIDSTAGNTSSFTDAVAPINLNAAGGGPGLHDATLYPFGSTSFSLGGTGGAGSGGDINGTGGVGGNSGGVGSPANNNTGFSPTSTPGGVSTTANGPGGGGGGGCIYRTAGGGGGSGGGGAVYFYSNGANGGNGGAGAIGGIAGSISGPVIVGNGTGTIGFGGSGGGGVGGNSFSGSGLQTQTGGHGLYGSGGGGGGACHTFDTKGFGGDGGAGFVGFTVYRMTIS